MRSAVSWAVRRAVRGDRHDPGMTPSRLPDRLRLEWRRLRSRPDALQHAAGWELVEGPLHDLDQVLAAVGYRVASSAPAESALRRLVLVAAGDELAARVVIERLLPGLLAAARRRHAHADDELGELLGAAWISIRTYNPSRRPGCIAAALISDAEYRAFRLPWRRAAHGERPTDLSRHDLEQPFTPTADEELASVLESALSAGLPAADIELVRRLACDASTGELAAEMKVTPRTVRNRRDRITAQLRELVLAA